MRTIGDVKGKKATNKVAVVVLTALLVGIYYSQLTGIEFIGVSFLYRYLWAAAVVLISLCAFLVTTDLNKMARLAKLTLLLCLPHLWTIFISFPIWVARLNAFEVMRRGFFNEIYSIEAVIAMAGCLYMLGEKAVWCNLIAIIIPNALIMITTVLESGFNQFFSEMWIAIRTFAGETGPVIQKMEIHEMTFALGAYVVFMIINAKKIKMTPRNIIYLLGASFFFLTGFKRIGIAAVFVALLAYFFLDVISRHGKRGKGVLMGCGIAAIVVMLLYVAVISMGLLDYIQGQLGIDVMGREHLLEIIRNYYHFGPGYFGYGTGFTIELIYDIRGTGLHNDILMLYIDLGFWGFLVWMTIYFLVRPYFVSRWQGLEGGILAFIYGVYLFATAATDNTTNYTYVTGTIALLTMAYNFDRGIACKEGEG